MLSSKYAQGYATKSQDLKVTTVSRNPPILHGSSGTYPPPLHHGITFDLGAEEALQQAREDLGTVRRSVIFSKREKSDIVPTEGHFALLEQYKEANQRACVPQSRLVADKATLNTWKETATKLGSDDPNANKLPSIGCVPGQSHRVRLYQQFHGSIQANAPNGSGDARQAFNTPSIGGHQTTALPVNEAPRNIVRHPQLYQPELAKNIERFPPAQPGKSRSRRTHNVPPNLANNGHGQPSIPHCPRNMLHDSHVEASSSRGNEIVMRNGQKRSTAFTGKTTEDVSGAQAAAYNSMLSGRPNLSHTKTRRSFDPNKLITAQDFSLIAPVIINDSPSTGSLETKPVISNETVVDMMRENSTELPANKLTFSPPRVISGNLIDVTIENQSSHVSNNGLNAPQASDSAYALDGLDFNSGHTMKQTILPEKNHVSKMKADALNVRGPKLAHATDPNPDKKTVEDSRTSTQISGYTKDGAKHYADIHKDLQKITQAKTSPFDGQFSMKHGMDSENHELHGSFCERPAEERGHKPSMKSATTGQDTKLIWSQRIASNFVSHVRCESVGKAQPRGDWDKKDEDSVKDSSCLTEITNQFGKLSIYNSDSIQKGHILLSSQSNTTGDSEEPATISETTRSRSRMPSEAELPVGNNENQSISLPVKSHNTSDVTGSSQTQNTKRKRTDSVAISTNSAGDLGDTKLRIPPLTAWDHSETIQASTAESIRLRKAVMGEKTLGGSKWAA